MLSPVALLWFTVLRFWRWHSLQRVTTPLAPKQEPLPKAVWVGLAMAMVWALAALSFLWWVNALTHPV